MKAGRLSTLIVLPLAALLGFPAPAAPGEEKAEKAAAKKSAGPGKGAGKSAGAEKKPGTSGNEAEEKGEASGKEEPPPGEPRALPEIEKDMKKAISGQDYALLGKLAQEAALLKDPAAYRAIINGTLRGDDRDLELKVFRLFIKIEDPAALPVICQEAGKNSNWKTRIVLLGVCFQKRSDPKAFAVLTDGLKDPHLKVKFKAVRWLKESKDADRAVPALIEALKACEKGPRGRLFYDVENCLKELTGADLELAADWKTFWESAKTGNKSKTTKSSLKTQVRPPAFFSVSIESDRVLFIIDISGSMLKKDPPLPEEDPSTKAPPRPSGRTVVRKTEAKEGEKKSEKAAAEDLAADRQRLFRVKKELVRLIQALPPNVNFTVMSFNHEIAFISGESPRLFSASPENKKRAEDWVRAMVANGETWTDTAFEKALGQLPEVDTIYFLSDGCPYRNGANIPPDKVREEIKVQNRFAMARIHTFGFAQEGKNLQRFLMAVAAENDGKYTALR